MNTFKTITICCMLPLLVAACNNRNTPEGPSIDSNPELVAACQHIEGGGASTTGGDNGAIYRISRLDDEVDPNTGRPAPGTLRYAVSQTDSRRIVFTVSGTIHLKSELRIKSGNLTIDGQSAPGDGICLADYPLVINASNVIVRFIRIRLGDESNTESDAVSVNNAKNVVLDHLSCSWSVDECVSCYGNENFTMQYCIISESLKNSVHGKGSHGYAGIWGGKNATFHHNLLAHHDSRNPRFDHDYVDTQFAGPIDHVNNVIYNWGGNSAYGGEGTSNGTGGRHINMVANYYKPGPATSSKRKTQFVDPWTSCSNCDKHPGGNILSPQIYLTANTMVGSSDVTANNWNGSTKPKSVAGVDTRWTDGLTPLKNQQTAEEAYETVLAKAGCSLSRDAVDTRIVKEVREGSFTYRGSNGSTNGLIDTQSDVGGWPELKTEPRPEDTDRDLIPDSWETQFGLDPNNPEDARLTTLVTGHSNLDVYYCHLVRNLY